jgi:hypothetical protein
MAIHFFIPDIGKTGPPDYEYAILVFIKNVLFSSYFTVNIQYVRNLGSIFKKLSFGSHDLCDVKSRVESKQQIYFIRRILRLRTSSEKFGVF